MQQDSAPCHTAEINKKWLADNAIQILEDWSSKSQDLNVIENCWACKKSNVSAHCPISEKDLINLLKMFWKTEISQDYCEKLVHSMPNRIKAVIANKGNSAKY